MKKKTLVISAIVAAFLVFVVLFFRGANTYVQSVMNILLYNIVVVLGLNFITGLTGQMNLATIGMLAFGAYTYGIMTTTYGWVPIVALIAIIAVGVGLGYTLGYPSLRLKGFYLSLTTIGFAEIVRLLVSNLDNLTGGTMGFYNVTRLLPIADKNSIFYLNLVITVIMVAIAFRLVYSKWGRAFKAIRDNVEAAEAGGIDIAKLKIQAFVLAAIYAVVGGFMYASYNTNLNPSGFTIAYSQNYVAMLMIGGIGTVPGNLIGATIVTVLPELLREFKDYYWIMFCTVCIVMAILIPDGLWPLIKKLCLKIAAKAKKPESKETAAKEVQ